MYKRTINQTLSFVGEPLIRDRHRIHAYPAMLHPMLIDYLLKNYANDNDIIFDPFCGSGVTLLQSSLNSHHSIGIDINPLALLIAQAKCIDYDIRQLKSEFEQFLLDINYTTKTDIPPITNIEYWYKEDVINDLGRIRYILKNNDYQYLDFFITCFAHICRNQSLTRNGEFKRYRMAVDKVEIFQGDVVNKLYKHIEMAIKQIETTTKPTVQPTINLDNSEKGIDDNIKYDFVITSPPYGDSRTTVAYGQYSSFGMDWTKDLTRFEQINYTIDNECIGKKGEIDQEIYQNAFLTDILEKIKDVDVKRSNDVLYFFNGYYKVIKNVIENLNDKGKLAFVVGNRTVKGHQIPMDQITARFFEMLGLNYNNIFVRDISSKVMPTRNSPTNIPGKTNSTMRHEYIVMFSKP